MVRVIRGLLGNGFDYREIQQIKPYRVNRYGQIKNRNFPHGKTCVICKNRMSYCNNSKKNRISWKRDGISRGTKSAIIFAEQYNVPYCYFITC